MSTYLFDIEAEATDADVDTDHEYSLDDISEGTSRDDENVDGGEVKPMPLLDKDFLKHPEASVIKYCRAMKGSCSTASDGSYDGDPSDSNDGDDGDGEDSDWEEGVEFNGGEDNDDRSESAESSKDDWLERRKARPSSDRKRSLFQVYLKQDSSYDSAEPESISTTPMKKRKRIYLDDDKDEEA